MKLLIQITVVVGILAAVGTASYNPVVAYWRNRNRPHWRQAEVSRGRIVSVINATGTIKPVLQVSVGSFVSGPIVELYVDFNNEVKKGDTLALVDPRLFQAAVDQNKAVLATRKAEVDRAEALWQQAVNQEERAQALHAENEDFISESEMDQYHFNTLSLKAQLEVAQTSVEQAQAALNQAEANLDYTKIVSPVDGIIIDRKIDRGQTLAAQFQTPELFIVGPDMRSKMHVFASVDEADIGLIRQAQKEDRSVQFTVDAYPEDLFEGRIEQIRMSSTTTQNVVTYPVIVAAANPDLKLLPGMTANISFQVDLRKECLKIPNSALRFYPEIQHVRREDRQLLEGADLPDEQDNADTTSMLSATEMAEAHRSRNRRHVWVVEGNSLRAVEVLVGISDNRYSELVDGDLKEGDKLVTGIRRETS